MPMFQLFDKQIQVRMGQANVRRWSDDILPLLEPTTTRSASSRSPPTTSRSRGARRPTRTFQKKEDGMVKVVFQP